MHSFFLATCSIVHTPGRAEAIRHLLLHAGLASADIASLETVSRVLANLLSEMPSSISVQPSVDATIVPLVLPRSPTLPVLATCASQWIPYCASAMCTCGKSLSKWRIADAHVFTLHAGMVSQDG